MPKKRGAGAKDGDPPDWKKYNIPAPLHVRDARALDILVKKYGAERLVEELRADEEWQLVQTPSSKDVTLSMREDFVNEMAELKHKFEKEGYPDPAKRARIHYFQMKNGEQAVPTIEQLEDIGRELRRAKASLRPKGA